MYAFFFIAFCHHRRATFQSADRSSKIVSSLHSFTPRKDFITTNTFCIANNLLLFATTLVSSKTSLPAIGTSRIEKATSTATVYLYFLLYYRAIQSVWEWYSLSCLFPSEKLDWFSRPFEFVAFFTNSGAWSWGRSPSKRLHKRLNSSPR